MPPPPGTLSVLAFHVIVDVPAGFGSTVTFAGTEGACASRGQNLANPP